MWGVFLLNRSTGFVYNIIAKSTPILVGTKSVITVTNHHHSLHRLIFLVIPAINVHISQSFLNLLTKVEKRLRLTKGEGGGDRLGDRDGRVHTTIYKT